MCIVIYSLFRVYATALFKFITLRMFRCAADELKGVGNAVPLEGKWTRRT